LSNFGNLRIKFFISQTKTKHLFVFLGKEVIFLKYLWLSTFSQRKALSSLSTMNDTSENLAKFTTLVRPKLVKTRSFPMAKKESEKKGKQGFASMDEAKQREIASMGGKAAHEKGTAHEFTPEEAREAGRKGGEAVSQDREHMAEIGREGGRNSHKNS
jgi:uncharacterized protein